MDEIELYQVVFSGQIAEEYDLDATKKNFARAFSLDGKKTERLFSGQEYVLKSNVTEEIASNFAMKLIEIGCECFVELMPFSNDVSQEPGFVEQRKSIRRHYYRRDPRSGSIVPDRRQLLSRRNIDVFLFKKDGDFPGNTIEKPR